MKLKQKALSAGLPRPVCPVVILSDRFGYPPWNPGVVDRPGKDGNWTAWEAFVAGEVASNLAKGRNGTAIFYDIWNEPDFHQFWDGTFDEFMETWYRGAVAIRNLDPGAMLVGPSVAFFNTTRVTTFLDYIVERNATLLPNVLTWHEVNNRVADYESHAIQMRQLVEGNANYSSISQVHLHEYGIPEVIRVPGPNVHAISAIDRAQVDGATRAIFSAGGWHDDTMNDLLTTDLEPTPVWHAYKAYASMSLYGGSMVRVQLAHEAVDGMVSWNDLGEIRCLLGNKEERHLAVRLVLDNIGARIAGVDRYRARIYEIPHDHAPALASMPLAGEALIDVHASPVSTFLSMAPLSALYVTFEPA